MRSLVTLLLGLSFFAPAPLLAQNAHLDSLRRAYALTQAAVERLVARRDSASTWADARFRAIAAARAEGRGALREALRTAQVAADSLAALDARLADAAVARKTAREALSNGLETELEAVLTTAEFSDDPQAKSRLLQAARELAIELTRVQEPLDLPPTDVPEVAVEPSDGPDDILLKADFLTDRAAQLRNAADVVASELSRRNKRAELQAEISRLVAEVRLFDQTRVPPAGAPTSSDGATSTGGGAAADRQGFNVQEGGADAPQEPAPTLLRPIGERGVDLSSGSARTSEPGGERSVEQLRRLRAQLLRRAAALEARARDIRAMLRGPP